MQLFVGDEVVGRQGWSVEIEEGVREYLHMARELLLRAAKRKDK